MKYQFKNIPLNIFSVLAIIASVALIFRGVNIITFDDTNASVVTSAQAVENPISDTEEKTPDITAEDIKRAVAETARAVNDGQDLSKTKMAANQAEAGKTEPLKTGEKSAPNIGEEMSEKFPQRSFTRAEVDILQSLSERRDLLDKREKQIGAQEALLEAAEQEVDRKVTELKTLRTEIENLLGKQKEEQSGRIQSLVKIYEGMKPKEAAIIFNTLDMNVLLSVIGRMSERKTSPILAAMDPEKARIVTIKLAEQKQLPGLPHASDD